MSLPELPSSNDKLFKGAEDWQYNACVDFKFHHSGKEHAYISGYKLAGDILCEKVFQDRHIVDLVVYPMVYNYRHYVELSLKAILHWGSGVLEQVVRPHTNHNLETLWAKVRPLVQSRWPEADALQLDAVENLILEIAGVDSKSTAFRYYVHDDTPNKKTGLSPRDEALTEQTQSVTHINVRNLSEVMERLSVFLDGVLTQFQVDWDNLCEARSIEEEFRKEYESEWESIMASDYYGYEDHSY